MNSISEEEESNILKNATSSFIHGIEHLLRYKNGEKNIKFSILHTFNAVELILKAYLGIINEALLWEKVDKKSNRSASISTLLKRMEQFSQVQFSEKLRNDIEELRKKRNEIEHKKFILENEKENVKLLINVIYELLIFCNKNVHSNLKENLTEEIKNELDNVRSEFDIEFKDVLNKVKMLKEKSFKVKECPDCLNKTLPYKKINSRIKCFYCNAEFIVIECNSCNELLIKRENEGGNLFCGALCENCVDITMEEAEDYNNKMVEEDDAEYSEKLKKFPLENYK